MKKTVEKMLSIIAKDVPVEKITRTAPVNTKIHEFAKMKKVHKKSHE